MLKFDTATYQQMYGLIVADAKGQHLCSCSCNCSCHCRCGIYSEDEYEKTLW